ncbi:hypothetical protein I3760_04G072600 [Carya illinoinensis]|nr:hypothetical protein I3760_04G072600 [Carya illinoinensis]
MCTFDQILKINLMSLMLVLSDARNILHLSPPPPHRVAPSQVRVLLSSSPSPLSHTNSLSVCFSSCLEFGRFGRNHDKCCRALLD